MSTMITLLQIVFHPGLLELAALALSIVWMLRDDRDKTRPLLVIALVINIFYGMLLSFVMGKEDSLAQWKYDYVLLNIDRALGVSATAMAGLLQHRLRIPLFVIYDLMIPMMIAWFLVVRSYKGEAHLIMAYVAEMVAGPILYVILPACGPRYAFGTSWLHPWSVEAGAIRLSGMPNAFPSLHIATAFVLLLFARGRLSRGVSVAFLIGTALATLSTGEHYVIDLVAGLAFGCFAAYAGQRSVRGAGCFLALVLAWSLTIRFGYEFWIASPILLKAFVAFTLCVAGAAVRRQWRAGIEDTRHGPQHSRASNAVVQNSISV